MNMDVDRTSRIRPALGGISIGHRDISAGTLGMVVRQNGERYILSNNHVLANLNKGMIGDKILQPGPYDGGTDEDTIATLHEFIRIDTLTNSLCPAASAIARAFNFLARLFNRATRLVPVVQAENLVDCALAKPINDHDVLDVILEAGDVTGVAEPEVGMAVKKSGRTTGLTSGEIVAVDAIAKVAMNGFDFAVFADQFVIELAAEGGDSGSIILTEDNKAVGLLFAGGEGVTIANKYSNVRRALGLEQ